MSRSRIPARSPARPMRRALPFVVAAVIAALGPACAGDTCTLLGCDDDTIITYPPGLVDGAYDLDVVGASTSYHARCLGPVPPGGTPNSPELSCDAEGFELMVGAATSDRTLRVTITDVDSETELAVDVEVAADAVDEFAPNGPDCAPVCIVRNGALMIR
ncbi:MAG: hypothetical protein IPN32_35295 [Deltaproteobacteria bacterium]|nr:hypothetical protein [Deltaproteobacteria bacterium]